MKEINDKSLQDVETKNNNSQWKTIRVVRKNKIITCQVGDTIYLPAYTKGRLWSDISALANFKKIHTKGLVIDFKIDCIIKGQEISFKVGKDVLKDSIITVLVWEGDLI